jgi:hypothetical protein
MNKGTNAGSENAIKAGRTGENVSAAPATIPHRTKTIRI